MGVEIIDTMQIDPNRFEREARKHLKPKMAFFAPRSYDVEAYLEIGAELIKNANGNRIESADGELVAMQIDRKRHDARLKANSEVSQARLGAKERKAALQESLEKAEVDPDRVSLKMDEELGATGVATMIQGVDLPKRRSTKPKA